MDCPSCRHEKTLVRGTTDLGYEVMRTRYCKHCCSYFVTLERMAVTKLENEHEKNG